jgi:hypothetical protein
MGEINILSPSLTDSFFSTSTLADSADLVGAA